MDIAIIEYLETTKMTTRKLKRKLHSVSQSIKLMSGQTMLCKKNIVSLLLRGFSEEAIIRIAYERYYNWDRPEILVEKYNQNTNLEGA